MSDSSLAPSWNFYCRPISLLTVPRLGLLFPDPVYLLTTFFKFEFIFFISTLLVKLHFNCYLSTRQSLVLFFTKIKLCLKIVIASEFFALFINYFLTCYQTHKSLQLVFTEDKIAHIETGYYVTPREKRRQNSIWHKSQQHLFWSISQNNGNKNKN